MQRNLFRGSSVFLWGLTFSCPCGILFFNPAADEAKMMRVCVECEAEFDTLGKAKRQAGGLSTHCPDCSEESTVRYAGVQNSDGKQAGVSILRFKTESDRSAYIDFWKVNSGFHKGKSCQIGHGLKTSPAFSYQTVAIFEGNTNHKGKS